MLSDRGVGGGLAAAMGSCSEPAASWVGGRIFGSLRSTFSTSETQAQAQECRYWSGLTSKVL